jgi:acyl carrier protein
MNREELKLVFKDVFNIIAPEVEFSKIQMDRALREQVELDSFDFYRVIVLISQKTGVSIPDSKAAELKNLDQIITYIIEQPNHHQWQWPGQ